MNILEFDKPLELSKHITATYQTLRVVLVVIALLFPWVLWIGGHLSNERIQLQPSMSDYYHANEVSRREFAERQAAIQEGLQRQDVQLDSGRGVLRNWFVGVLFVISALLFVYKGYRPAEDVALNLAGIFAVLIAVFPNAWDGPGLPFHGIFAVSFFLCIAYVCIFCASATLSLIEDEDKRKRYRRLYKFLGWAMVATPVIAAILSEFVQRRTSYIFFAEAAGVYAFAAYWLVKTREISETNADRRAASGELFLPAGTGPTDAVRNIRVGSVSDQKVGVPARSGTGPQVQMTV
jgi:hypothetical membrane protein